MKIGQLNPIFDATDRQLGGWTSYNTVYVFTRHKRVYKTKNRMECLCNFLRYFHDR